MYIFVNVDINTAVSVVNVYSLSKGLYLVLYQLLFSLKLITESYWVSVELWKHRSDSHICRMLEVKFEISERDNAPYMGYVSLKYLVYQNTISHVKLWRTNHAIYFQRSVLVWLITSFGVVD